MTESLERLKALSKAKSYIGFAKKAGKLKIGTDNILAYKKNSDIIISKDISDNAKNKINNHAIKTNSNVTQIKSNILIELMDSENIKAFAITDKNLALACVDIIKNLEETIVD